MSITWLVWCCFVPSSHGFIFMSPFLQEPSMDDSSSNSIGSPSEYDHPPCYTSFPNYNGSLTQSNGSPAHSSHRYTWKPIRINWCGQIVLQYTAPDSATSCTSAEFVKRYQSHFLGFYSHSNTAHWSVFIEVNCNLNISCLNFDFVKWFSLHEAEVESVRCNWNMIKILLFTFCQFKIKQDGVSHLLMI